VWWIVCKWHNYVSVKKRFLNFYLAANLCIHCIGPTLRLPAFAAKLDTMLKCMNIIIVYLWISWVNNPFDNPFVPWSAQAWTRVRRREPLRVRWRRRDGRTWRPVWAGAVHCPLPLQQYRYGMVHVPVTARCRNTA